MYPLFFLHLHFTFMHLADAFIQSDLHCIQVTVSALAFPGNRTHDLGVVSAMLYQLSYRKVEFFIYVMVFYNRGINHLSFSRGSLRVHTMIHI